MSSLLAISLKEARDDINVARMYAKKGCNKCSGKGHVHRDVPGRAQWIEVCRCVINKIRKQVENDKLDTEVETSTQGD